MKDWEQGDPVSAGPFQMVVSLADQADFCRLAKERMDEIGRRLVASAMSAGTAETLQAAQGQSPASAVANGETPNPISENPHGN